MKRGTKKVLKCVIVVGSCIAVIAVIVLAFVLWYRNIEKEIQELEGTPVPTPCVTATLEPTGAEVLTKMPEKEPAKALTSAPKDEVSPTIAPVITKELTPTPTVTPSPVLTKEPTATPSPTPTKAPTATPVPQRKYVYEAKMGDNVWYRLTEDGTLYVTGTGATYRLNYSYDKGTGFLSGRDARLNDLMELNSAQHIIIEEGVTKLGGWSLMWFFNVQSITFPSSLKEIEDYCFFDTGKTVNIVWIGLDKSKVKLGKDAFYGTVYQTEEDLRKPTPIPTSSPTPTSLPMEAHSFYKALVEEACIKIDENDKEPYSAALVREGILEGMEVKSAEKTLANQEVALLLYRTAQKFKCENNQEVVAASKKYERIADKEGIVPGYEDAVYFCFGNGIMTGKNPGEYSHERYFNPKNSIREADGMLYCKRLFHPEERIPMSPDAQVIRTTNLPVQAKLYPYILESFPNEYYDMNYLYMYNVETDDRAYPDLLEYSSFLETWCTPNTVEEFSENQPERCRIFTSETDYIGFEAVGMNKVVECYRDTWEQQAREYLELVFNFDYRTVREDIEWQNRIKNLNVFYHEWGKGALEGSCAGMFSIDEWFAKFLDYAEEYHTVVECSDIDFDMSTLFYSERFTEYTPYTIRVHLRYKITTDAEPESYMEAEVIPMCAYDTVCSFTSFGEWKDVYAELTFATNSFDRTGIGGVRILEYNVNDAIRYHFDPKQYTE